MGHSESCTIFNLSLACFTDAATFLPISARNLGSKGSFR